MSCNNKYNDFNEHFLNTYNYLYVLRNGITVNNKHYDATYISTKAYCSISDIPPYKQVINNSTEAIETWANLDDIIKKWIMSFRKDGSKKEGFILYFLRSNKTKVLDEYILFKFYKNLKKLENVSCKLCYPNFCNHNTFTNNVLFLRLDKQFNISDSPNDQFYFLMHNYTDINNKIISFEIFNKDQIKDFFQKCYNDYDKFKFSKNIQNIKFGIPIKTFETLIAISSYINLNNNIIDKIIVCNNLKFRLNTSYLICK
jgi:hypothetical protein